MTVSDSAGHTSFYYQNLASHGFADLVEATEPIDGSVVMNADDSIYITGRHFDQFKGQIRDFLFVPRVLTVDELRSMRDWKTEGCLRDEQCGNGEMCVSHSCEKGMERGAEHGEFEMVGHEPVSMMTGTEYGRLIPKQYRSVAEYTYSFYMKFHAAPSGWWELLSVQPSSSTGSYPRRPAIYLNRELYIHWSTSTSNAINDWHNTGKCAH